MQNSGAFITLIPLDAILILILVRQLKMMFLAPMSFVSVSNY